MAIKKTLFEVVSAEFGYSWPCGDGADSDPDPINEFYAKFTVKRIGGEDTRVQKLDVGRHESHILHHELDTAWTGWDCYSVSKGDRIELVYEDRVSSRIGRDRLIQPVYDTDIFHAEVLKMIENSELFKLKAKYPFLETIINDCSNLFAVIEETDNGGLDRCRTRGYDCTQGESTSWAWYGIRNGAVKALGEGNIKDAMTNERFEYLITHEHIVTDLFEDDTIRIYKLAE